MTISEIVSTQSFLEVRRILFIIKEEQYFLKRCFNQSQGPLRLLFGGDQSSELIFVRHSGIFLCRFWSNEKYPESKNWFEEITENLLTGKNVKRFSVMTVSEVVSAQSFLEVRRILSIITEEQYFLKRCFNQSQGPLRL